MKVITNKLVVKTIKSKLKATNGVASLVQIQVIKWHGCARFTMLLMDDFEVALGQYFLRRNKVVSIPWLDQMIIIGDHKMWVVPTNAQNPRGKVQLVSALSMNRKTGCPKSYLNSTTIEKVTNEVEIPILPNLYGLLGEFVDQMLDELLKVLQPRHIIDHHIDLEAGLEPLARAPYRQYDSNLEELKSSILEFIDACVIHPS